MRLCLGKVEKPTSKDQGTPVEVSTGSPQSFGWQRRPDCDTPTGEAWEHPEGAIVLFEKGREPVLARLKRLL